MSPQDEFSSFGASEEQQPTPSEPQDEFAAFSEEVQSQGQAAWDKATEYAATATAAVEGDPSKDNWAIAATVVGVLSLCVAIVPLCGFPTSLAAIALGAFSLKAPNRRTLAIVGIVLGVLAILLSTCSAAFGVIGMLGQQTGGGY